MRRSAATSSVISWRRWSPDWRASSTRLSMPGPLLVDDVAQPLGDVLVGAAQVVAVEHLPPALAEPFEDLAHAGDPLAVAVREAALHEALQGLVEVAVVEELVGELAEDVVGVELEADLGAIPLGVPEPGHASYVRPALPGPVGGPGARPRPC